MRATRWFSRRLLLLVPLLALTALVLACSAPQTYAEPRSDNTDQIWDLQMLLFVLAAIVFAVVMVLTVGFSIMFREREGRTARQFHGNTRLEVVWTLIPVIIVAIIAIPTFKTIFDTERDPPDNAIEVQVTGYQWWWEFVYEGMNITTANELHVPVGRPISIKLRSNDVIHSFWVPQLFGKEDMVPGHENTLWFTPNEAREEPYLGQCAELCGISHANMRFRVFVHTQEDFDAWARQAASDRAAPTGAAAEGEQAFLSSPCIGCHTIQGTIAQAKIGPNLTNFGSRTTLGAGMVPNTPENLKAWISRSQDIKPGSKMPPMADWATAEVDGVEQRGTLTEQQIDQIVTYLQSLR